VRPHRDGKGVNARVAGARGAIVRMTGVIGEGSGGNKVSQVAKKKKTIL